MAQTEYTRGFANGVADARKKIIYFIEHHLENDVDLTALDILKEINYQEKQDAVMDPKPLGNLNLLLVELDNMSQTILEIEHQARELAADLRQVK
jgi:hypothetical protein